MEENLKKIAELNDVVQAEGIKFAAGNKSAGTRLRKALQEITVLSKETRKQVQDIKNQ